MTRATTILQRLLSYSTGSSTASACPPRRRHPCRLFPSSSRRLMPLPASLIRPSSAPSGRPACLRKARAKGRGYRPYCRIAPMARPPMLRCDMRGTIVRRARAAVCSSCWALDVARLPASAACGGQSGRRRSCAWRGRGRAAPGGMWKHLMEHAAHWPTAPC